MLKERIAKLEGTIGGLQHVQTQIFVAVSIGAAVVSALLIYALARIDSLSDKVNALPSQIGAELRDITKTLAESITAAKQQPPQVILLPEKKASSTQQK